MKFGKIRQIALGVKDLEASKAFYGDVLGQPLLFEAPPQMAFYDLSGIRLMLSQAEEVTPGGPILYFSVDNCDAAYKALSEKGAHCIRAPLLTHKTETMELWLAFFTDPDGHTLALMEERAI